MRNYDYLQIPPNAVEKQTAPSDIAFSANMAILQALTDIRNELCKLNPDVLCMTTVQGGNVITDTAPRIVKFEVGGKPVTVYKVLLWSQSDAGAAVTVSGMADGSDGFALASAELIQLHIPVSELSVALTLVPASGVGVNIPSNLQTGDQGSIFIYGFTIPNNINYTDRG